MIDRESDAAGVDRLERVESYQAIQQLAVRYALAVDSKDLEALAGLFVSDVNAGREWGVGRDAIERFYRSALANFYRSIHFVCGHVIEFEDSDHADGVVYCRAEHERGPLWWVWAANYHDEYERESGTWYFRRRRAMALYTTDVISRPSGPGFLQGPTPNDGSGRTGGPAPLPGRNTTFAEYWHQFPPSYIAEMTVDPVD